MTDESKLKLDVSGDFQDEAMATIPVTRGAVESTVAEDPSFINVREVEDWCRESREYRPPILSSVTLISLSLGLLAGFGPALAATDIDVNGAWWGVFLFGTLLAVFGCVVAVGWMFLEHPPLEAIKRWKHSTSLERLADRMERACTGGRLRASQAETALREREEREREGTSDGT